MAPLPNDTVREVLDTCDHLFKERQQIAVILAELPESFGAVRTALNDLQRILGHNPT